MEPKRIVLVLVDPPLPFGKAMGRWYYVLLRGLVARGHHVSAFVTCASAAEVAETERLFPQPAYDVRCYLTPDPASLGPVGRLASKLKTLRRPYSYVFTPAFRRDFNATLADGYDILHLEIHWSGWLALKHTRRAVLSIAFLFQIDFADQPPRGLVARLHRLMTFRAERSLIRRFPQLITVSPRLTEYVLGFAHGPLVRTIPFALDFSLYPLLDAAPADRPPTIGLIASFNWTPGRTAGERLLDRLWPEIYARMPSARLHLAGVDARKIFASHLDRPGVMIDDRVTDVPAFFRGIDLQLYAPNDSSGMKFKVLESFAFGIPVVTTPSGVEGLPAVDGLHAGIALDDAGLISRTLALLSDPALLARQRLAARALVASHCDPVRVLNEVERVYEQILHSSPQGSSTSG